MFDSEQNSENVWRDIDGQKDEEIEGGYIQGF